MCHVNSSPDMLHIGCESVTACPDEITRTRLFSNQVHIP